VELRISPNTVLTKRGLEVSGTLRQLGHRDAFVMVARATGASVATVLERVFPNTRAAPLPTGAAEPTSVPAWVDYSGQLHALAPLAGDSDDILVRGQVLVQWCIAAHVAAVVGNLDVAREPEFLAVEYLAQQGAASLAHTPQSWQNHLDWLAWSKTPAALHAQLTGEGDRPRSQPTALRITTPWPELLGADLGGPARLLENISRHSADIIVAGESTTCRMLGHSVRISSDLGLVERFNAESVKAPGTALCGFDWEVGGVQYFVRAQRSQLRNAECYVFRLLPTQRSAMPALDALLAQ